MTTETQPTIAASVQAPILLVEDEASSARLMVRAFQRNQIANPVEVLADAETAMERLSLNNECGSQDTLPPLPGLILTDHRLPRITGLDLTRFIKSDPRTQSIPCVILSASGNPEDIVEAYRMGANCFLVKPQRFAELQALLASVHTFFLMRNRPEQTN